MTREVMLENIKSLDGNMRIEDILSGFMPRKIGQVIIKEVKINSQDKLSQIKHNKLKELVSVCKGFGFTVTGTKGYDFAQVTSGGADTKEFDRETMQSKKVRGLYCIGELLDVDGDCGGYNLNWAWSSGRLAAKSITEQK